MIEKLKINLHSICKNWNDDFAINFVSDLSNSGYYLSYYSKDENKTVKIDAELALKVIRKLRLIGVENNPDSGLISYVSYESIQKLLKELYAFKTKMIEEFSEKNKQIISLERAISE